MAVQSQFDELVKSIDPHLEFVGFIGEGTYSLVLEVKLNDTHLALKINKRHEAFYLDSHFTIENEFNVMKALKGIHGIPRVFKFYKKSPCILQLNRIGKNAFLRELIPGKRLDHAGNQRRIFFMRLGDLVEAMIQKGYIILSDFSASNILVGKDGYPHLIDMMCALKLSSNKKIKEQQIALFRRKYSEITSEVEKRG